VHARHPFHTLPLTRTNQPTDPINQLIESIDPLNPNRAEARLVPRAGPGGLLHALPGAAGRSVAPSVNQFLPV
jgi:hypothetical protein